MHAQQLADTTKPVSFAAVPIVNYSNTLGFSAGLMAQMFYKLDKKDTISPASSTGVFGMYTTNHTYLAAVFQRAYFDNDNWRLMFGAGTGNINFQYWQEIPVIGGGFIGFETHTDFLLLRLERRVYDQLYAGFIGMMNNATTDYDVPDYVPEQFRSDKRNLNNLGYILNFDKREHQINPYGGYNVEFKQNFFRNNFGSDNNFDQVQITYNHFYKIGNERNIIATRFRASISTGDVPFQGQNVVGQDDIRGYSSGKYRDNQTYALQAEYRWRFYKNLGMVGFAGIATAVPDLQNTSGAPFLPGAGLGIRYMMIPDQRINVGFDFAVGKDDWGLYFRIGESFTR